MCKNGGVNRLSKSLNAVLFNSSSVEGDNNESELLHSHAESGLFDKYSAFQSDNLHWTSLSSIHKDTSSQLQTTGGNK